MSSSNKSNFTIFDNYTVSSSSINASSNLSCHIIKYNYLQTKSVYNFVRTVAANSNRFFIIPAIILNLCAFYILRRTRMNRSSSIAFYMQVLALCDVAFFTMRVIFGELSNLPAGKFALTAGMCKFLFLMVNAVNYTTVWLIAAMNADKLLAVCMPLRVSDLLSRKKAYGVVGFVIICSMLVASVHASRTTLKNNSYCWLKTPQDEKLVFILDAFVWCFVPFVVISILNAAIFFALLKARREASHLVESTCSTSFMLRPNSSSPPSLPKFNVTKERVSSNFLRTSNQSIITNPTTPNMNVLNSRARIQSQNLQITIMLITISICFFVLTLPNAIYYLLILFQVLIESWKVVKCDQYLHKNLDVYVRTSAVIGARFRNEFRRLIFFNLCHRWKNKQHQILHEQNRSFVKGSALPTVQNLSLLPNHHYTRNNKDYISTSSTTIVKIRQSTNDKNEINGLLNEK
ncbi:unnamed protein product [Didymodactylos carnosus]|uniref:G-protein coupled receptors family 1 profile domain-containing protein n=1 Tax=Didymodactylos carnosus TaxID=1234261 RepID=A0A814V7A8_9BILA|nr:unnamed protein product [Didymodactylos carnosus]CAF1185150.1 unnamed protein product [Didymodactylos carnosus]CAF3687350.1 unnamed protein product [Didymodactylos carnosus]CAF3949400.1 unnamed protein product [Didymodactylos carnosus]